MYVEFNELPDNARVWIYQANRPFTQEELNTIEVETKTFVENWTRHGKGVRGSYTVKYNQFLIIASDQDFVEVSGCSIDASVHLVQEFQKAFDIDMLNKLTIGFKVDENINTVDMFAFKKYVTEGKITSNTTVFNNMVNTKEALATEWEVPAINSWHKRFFN